MTSRHRPTNTEACPCGSGSSLAACCAPYIDGNRNAPTAEALMRSRYSAYVTMNREYLLASWHSSTRPSRVRLDENQHWLGLRIKQCAGGGETDRKGLVEFVARYKVAGRGHRLHENSRFLREDDRWYYVDGEHL